MSLPISDIVTLALSLTVSQIWQIFLENAHFSYPLHSTPNLKALPLHRIPKFCTQRASTRG